MNLVVTKEDTTGGFGGFMNNISKENIMKIFEQVISIYEKIYTDTPYESIIISGEFCGENLQKKQVSHRRIYLWKQKCVLEFHR